MQVSLARSTKTTMTKTLLVWLCACVFLSAFGFVHAAAPSSDDAPLLHVERVGIPFPSWSSPVNGRNASKLIKNPTLTRSALLAPRFHRMLRYGLGLETKTQTAVFVAGRTADEEAWGTPGASMVSALNPRDGGIVWRSLRNESDPIHSMHLSSDVLVTVSGIDRTRVSLLHALTGAYIWATPMPLSAGASHSGLVDAALLPPPSIGRDPQTATVAALAPDVIAMDRSGAVHRFAGINGALIWSNDPIAKEGDTEEVIPLKLHSDKRHTVVVSYVKSAKAGLFSASELYGLRLTVYQANSGARLRTLDVPNAEVETSSVFAEYDTTSNVLIIGRDAETVSDDRAPHLVWLQNDGTIKSFEIPLSDETDTKAIEASSVRSIKPKQSSRFNALVDVAKLRNRGVLVARTNNGRAEVLRIGKKEKHLISFWEMEEEAWDSVFFGGVDRQNRPYLNRVFFGRAQHLLNFHTMWVDVYDEQGQVTGASFQWDHDLNGDVLAAPFEVSPVNDYQLIWRAAFFTQSSSIRMLQDEKHQWIREDGLSHTTASIMIDLPESKLSAGQGSEARTILEGETFFARIERHLIALQSLPSYTLAAVLKGVREVPNLSLESFGITAPKRSSKVSSSSPGKQTPDVNKKRGAAPLPGVGAQKIGSTNKQVKPRQGVPQPMPRGSRRVSPVTKEEGPPPPAHVAPREANATIINSLTRDKFGFRKLIVAVSKAGKIYAIDSKDGSFVWEKSLFGFGQGEGASVPAVDVKLLALVQPVAGSGAELTTPIGQAGSSSEEIAAHTSAATKNQLEHLKGGLLTIVATVHDEGATFTRMWEIEPLTGRFPGGKDSQTGIALFPGEVKDSFLLPIEDEQTGQIAAAAVSQDDKILLWPITTSIQTQFTKIGTNFFYAVREVVEKQGISFDVLTGYTPVSAPDVRGQKAWQLPLPEGEKVVSIVRAVQDPVASQGKVLGDRRTMYKYLNPHLLVVLTKDVHRRSACAYIIDSVTGKIVFQTTLAQGNLALTRSSGAELNPQAVLTENWASIEYEVDIAADDAQARYKGAHRQTRLLSIEMYEADTGNDETWQWKGVFSSFGSNGRGVGKGPNTRRTSASSLAATPPHAPSVTVYAQLYVLPYGVRGMASSRTKLGISSKALIIATSENNLQVLPRRVLDPRRPVGRKATTQEMEEGLITYDAFVQDNGGKFKVGKSSVPLPRRIRVKPSQLESTGVVLVDQSVDLFITTVAPSGKFDLLSKSFNKLQLLLTMTVLSAGLFITRPMVASKMLRMRW